MPDGCHLWFVRHRDPMSFQHVLFPGRHHAVTRFQTEYLTRLLAGEEVDSNGDPIVMADDAHIVWAVTSASHANTRRNPVPSHRRVGLIERIAAVEELPSVVVEIPDVPNHPRFAHLVVTTATTELNHLPAVDPSTTIVACSTDYVVAEYEALGYRIAPVEAGTYPRPGGPWEVVEMCGAGNPAWTDVAHPLTVSYWRRYNLDAAIAGLFADPVISDEGDLTATRDYRTYATSFENASARKWAQLRDHVRPGRVLDIGCATGGLLEQVGRDPNFSESDLFGVDVARPLLAEAEHKKAAGVFANPNVWFLRANALTGAVMPERSVDTTVTVALTHELASYGDGVASLATFASRIHAHTRPGGVWVNSDVLGPDQPERKVVLTLRTDDGENPAAPWTDLDDLAGREVAARVEALSTSARMQQFAYDFARLSGSGFTAGYLGDGRWQLQLRYAMEFMTRKDYTDNWLSECHERFCDFTYADWVNMLTAAGFTLATGSEPIRNEWLVENRFNPTAELSDADTGVRLEWPSTHVLTVARRATAE